MKEEITIYYVVSEEWETKISLYSAQATQTNQKYRSADGAMFPKLYRCQIPKHEASLSRDAALNAFLLQCEDKIKQKEIELNNLRNKAQEACKLLSIQP